MSTSARRALEEIGGHLQFFVQSCLFIAQHPGAKPGSDPELRWLPIDASFSAMMTGLVMELFASSRAVNEHSADALTIERGLDEVVLCLKYRVDRPLDESALEAVREFIESEEIAGDAGAFRQLRLKFSSRSLGPALTSTDDPNCPPTTAGRSFRRPVK